MFDHTQLNNTGQLLDALEIQTGNRVLLKYMEDTEICQMDSPTFFRNVRRCAAKLDSLGLAGKHIGIMGTNRWQWMAHLCAVFAIGGVAVLLAPDLNAEELAQRAEHADVVCVLHDGAIPVSLPGIAAVSMDDPLPEQEAYGRREPSGDDLACILFTSGTTARSKAVMYTHKATIAGICHNIIGIPFRSQLAILPLHHIAGFASVLNTWYLNRVICLGADYKYLFRYLEAMKPDYILTVPSLLQVILRKLKKGGENGHLLGWDLHLIGCGGAQFQPDVLQDLNDRGIRVLQSYGATEAGGLGFDYEMTPKCRNTIGKPCKEVQTRIVEGELYLRCQSMMLGYYKDEAATKEVLIDGWYATGDLCRQDEEGYLWLTGRKKNLIILSNGENVSPEEIEGKLSQCPQISEILIGVENDRICAHIHPREISFPLAEYQPEIRNFIDRYNDTVPTYKQVHILHFYPEPFAKTQVGKMIRRTITGGNPS